MSELPFILSFDSDPTYYGHDMFPNRLYRQHHPRHHIPLDFPTLGLIARLGAHAHHLHPHKTGEAIAAGHKHHINNANNNSKHDFEVHLDVGLFKPEEITVKVVNDCVVVEGKHEEREDDHGAISRHFQRRYVLPKNCNLDDIVSTMTTDGVLTVSIPKPAIEEKPKERVIEIKQIGPSDLFLHDRKHNTQHEVSKTDESTKNHNEA